LIQTSPLSPLDKLAYRFCEMLRLDLQGGATLASFGKFMIEVPHRIGLQKLYDLSVESVCLAHGALLARSERLLLRSREVYGHALYNLQQCLKNGLGARSSETLCGTVLLSIYEVCRSIAAEDKIDSLCN
jgi:hypothetical protein